MTEDEFTLAVALTRAKAAKNLIEEIPLVPGLVSEDERDSLSETILRWCLGLRRKANEMMEGWDEGEEPSGS